MRTFADLAPASLRELFPQEKKVHARRGQEGAEGEMRRCQAQTNEVSKAR